MRFGIRHALTAFGIALAATLMLDTWMPFSWLLLLLIVIVLTIPLARAVFWLDALLTAIRLGKLNRETLALAKNAKQKTPEIDLEWATSFLYEAELRGRVGFHRPLERLREEVTVTRKLQEAMYFARHHLSKSQLFALAQIQDAERRLLVRRRRGVERCPHESFDSALFVHIDESYQGSMAFHTYWCPLCLNTVSESWAIAAIPG